MASGFQRTVKSVLTAMSVSPGRYHIASFGVSTGWASPNLIDSVSVVLGAVLTAVVTYMVPNQPKA